MKKFLCIALCIVISACSSGYKSSKNIEKKQRVVDADRTIVLSDQGSFFIGGDVVHNRGKYDPKRWSCPQGQTRHGDHSYVFYQIPQRKNQFSTVFLHGASQSGKCWESTPDGREGFQNIFLRHGYPVYIVDQPRCGRSGQGLSEGVMKNTTMDQLCFDIFRIGVWPRYYDGVQFPTDSKSLEQFFRQATPNIGEFDQDLASNAIAALFEKIGDGILVAHSQGCRIGWHAAMRNDKIRAIVAIEPGNGLPFPKGECPKTVRSSSGITCACEVDFENFMKLTKIPIVILFGDNIPDEANDIPGQDNWYQRLKMSRLWAETINRYGGKAQVIHLPEIGIFGNTHFMFADKNNHEIANVIFKFLKENGFEKR